MAKPDFPALLIPGMHALTLDELFALAVAPYPNDERRADLFQKLTTWADALKAIGISGQLWLDGSFLTEKPGPGDIDCVLWSPTWIDPDQITHADKAQAMKLLNRAHAEAIFDLDLYLETPATDQIFHREAYWRGILGFCHDRLTAKGFAEIAL